MNILRYVLVAALLAICGPALAQPAQTTAQVVSACGTPIGTYAVGSIKPQTQDTTGKTCSGATFSGSVTANTTATASATPTAVSAGTGVALNENLFSSLFVQPTFAGTPVDATHGLPTNCITGCSGGPADESAITFGTTPIFTGGVYQTTATSNALTTGQMGIVQMTAQRAFFINLRNSAGAESGVAAVPLQVSLANTAANATAVLVTGTGGTFPVSGATSNASSAVATSSTNVSSVAYNYGFNGTTWDQLQVDGSKFLKVTVAAALPAGTNLMGKVGIDQTTPGTTNGISIVGVNAATALAGAGAVGTGAQRVAVGQDATTVAGMAPGTVGAGTAPADMLVGGCIYNATNPAATDTQSVAIQCDTAGRLKVNAQPATQNAVSGTANTTGNSTTSLVSAVTSNRIYVSAFSCANTGASASLISFQDGSGGTTLWTTIVPAGGGSNVDGNTALFKTTSGNGVYFLPATASTTIYCSAAGYSGP